MGLASACAGTVARRVGLHTPPVRHEVCAFRCDRPRHSLPPGSGRARRHAARAAVGPGPVVRLRAPEPPRGARKPGRVADRRKTGRDPVRERRRLERRRHAGGRRPGGRVGFRGDAMERCDRPAHVAVERRRAFARHLRAAPAVRVGRHEANEMHRAPRRAAGRHSLRARKPRSSLPRQLLPATSAAARGPRRCRPPTGVRTTPTRSRS